MNKIKYGDLLFAILMAAALLALFLAYEYSQKPGVNMPLPAAALPVPPSEAGPENISTTSSSGGASLKKENVVIKPKKKRKKRVSRLREPGEALLGGAAPDAGR